MFFHSSGKIGVRVFLTLPSSLTWRWYISGDVRSKMKSSSELDFTSFPRSLYRYPGFHPISVITLAKNIRQDQKQLAQAKKRLADVEKLMTRLYEDHVLGSLPEERYQKMTADYEEEQENLRAEIMALEEWIEAQQETTDNYDRFSALVGKYVDIPVLTPTIANEFIQKIIVHAPDKSSGKRKQQIEIIFNFVGQVDIPILTTPIVLEQKPQNRKTA